MPDEPIEPTIVSTRGAFKLDRTPEPGEETIISTTGPARPRAEQRRAPAQSPASASRPAAPAGPRPWKSYAVAFVLIALVSAIAGAGLIAFLMNRGDDTATPAGVLLTVKKPTNGTIVGGAIRCGTRGADCTSTVAPDALVSLALIPDNGFVAGGYTDDCGPSGEVRMTAARTCGATFVPVSGPAPPVTTAPSGAGTGEPQTLSVYPDKGGVVFVGNLRCSDPRGCHWPFPAGTAVDLSAQADPGFTFENFGGAAGSCDAEGHVVMDKPKSCSVRFVPNRAGVIPPPAPPPTSSRPTSKPQVPTPTVPSGAGEKPTAAPPTAATPVETAPPPPPGTVPPGAPQAPPSESAAPPPPPAPLDETEVAKKEIVAVLEQYRVAYESRNFDAVKQVYPTAPGALRDQFKDLSSAKIAKAGEPTFESLNAQQGTAVVETSWNRATVSKRVGKEQGTQILRVFLHKKNRDNRWEIGNVLFRTGS